VLTTLESIGDARAFVRELVNRGVVACGTIMPSATSIYRWEGKITETTEAVVLLKTSRERWQDLTDATNELHPYKVPELLSLPVAAGLDRYLAWVSGETIGPGKKESR
jgi:periplasmic divalent cation tolerance protein